MKTRFIKLAFLIFTFSFLSFNSGSAQMFWNQACQFAGTTSSYITVPNSSSINITGSFSLEAWINPSSLSGVRTIISKGGTLGSDRYGLEPSSGKIRIFTNSTIRLSTRQSTIIPLNQWTHIAGTYNSTTNQFRIYVNGVLDTSVTIAGAAPLASTDSLYIGTITTGLSYAGQMDEVRIWNRELSSTEVSQYFRSSMGISTGIYSGLVMSHTFQSNHALINFLSMFDQSGNQNNGFNRGVSVLNQADRPLQTITLNESAELDGTEDYLAAADASSISPTTGITLEAWVYPRNTNPCTYLSKGTNYRLGFNGVQVTFGINNNFFGTGAGLTTNRWSHIALTYSGSTGIYAFYLNGLLQSTNTISLGNVIDGTDSLLVGGGPAFGDLNGYIDEVRIAHYVKSQQLINEFLYQSIDEINAPFPIQINIVYNLDGIANSNAFGAPRLTFRNNARLSHPGTILDQPISPLNRNDPSNFSEAYYMVTSNKRIPSTGTSGSVADSTTVNLNTTITDVNLFVALNHLNSFSLEVVLVAPNGDSVKVFDNKNTISLDENLITVFNDQADSSLINNRYATFSPVIKPENNMNAIFSGDNSQGRWKLIVRDEQTNDTGFLYAWGIQFNNISQRPKDLNLSALIQGFYNPSTNLMVPDTMRVYIRNLASPFAILDSSKAVLSSIGLGLFSFSSVNVINNQQYYIQLKHRNSIETWSNPFSFINDEASYSFFGAASSAFGNNQIQVDASPVRFAIYSGDVNQDGIIDAGDLSLVDNDAFNSVSGYVNTDLNGDDFVDASDLSIADNNVFNGVIAITP